jgi:GDP-4-dehydro-6-deoxy-D-mannose reductase
VRSLITGVGGFVGQHLAALLLKETDDEVFGIARSPIHWHRAEACENSAFRLLNVDLNSPEEVLQSVQIAAPTQVFLLAAMSSPAASFGDPLGTLTNNAACVMNVLDALRREAPDARVVLVSSAEVYGASPDGGGAIDESVRFAPENPYALSKAIQDLLGGQYHASYGMDIVRIRPFNHTGPGQSDRFVTASLARQIAEIELGRHEPVIKVGNLRAIRDFTDVRDVVNAYDLAAKLGVGGEAYNLASGQRTSIEDLLDRLVALSGVTVKIEHDPSRVRPADASVLVGNPARFIERTGWAPQIPLDQTLSDILDEWRMRVRAA